MEEIAAAGAVPAIGTTMMIVDHMVEMAVVTAATVSDLFKYSEINLCNRFENSNIS